MMTVEDERVGIQFRHHDTLPTIAVRRTMSNWIKAYMVLPIGRDFPPPRSAILRSPTSAEVVEGGVGFLVRVTEVVGDLNPGQKVIIFKRGQAE